MATFIGRFRWGLFLLALLVLLLHAGCAGKEAPDVEEGQDEQLYIDAKLGISLLHPLHWKKLQLPVSSPEYRQDAIVWEFPNEKRTGRMEVRVLPPVNSREEMTEILEGFLAEGPEHSGEDVIPFTHEAGEAVVTTIYYRDHAQRLFVVAGENNAYILSFFASSEGFIEELPLFETIANSLREL